MEYKLKEINYYCPKCNKNINDYVKNKKFICECGYNFKDKIDTQDKIYDLVKDYFKVEKSENFEYGKTVIPLSTPTFNTDEIFEAMQTLLTTFVTMGDKVKLFEQKFSKYLQMNYSTLVTSGSTANSLALSCLTDQSLKNRIQPGDEIIAPALTFATSVYPILEINAVPVLVDIDLDTLNIDEKLIEESITPKTKALMPVHLLGNPCKMDEIKRIAEKYNLWLIEDAADSSGSEYHGKKVGSLGHMSTFSFFFTHIMTTIEGGMVSTDDKNLNELLKSKRSFGWVRDMENKKYYEDLYKDIDPRFLFLSRGFNFKPTEIQGAFGMHQIRKLDSFVEARRTTANYWSNHLKKYSDFIHTIEEQPNTKSAWYGFPIIVKEKAPFKKEDMIEFLNSRGVQTRPILSGNITQQPVAKTFEYKAKDLSKSIFVNNNSFWVGNHQGIQDTERKAVASYFDDFMKKFS